jgi:hypothetical protein
MRELGITLDALGLAVWNNPDDSIISDTDRL